MMFYKTQMTGLKKRTKKNKNTDDKINKILHMDPGGYSVP